MNSGNPIPKADRPLRVAILGWARLDLQAREGSGYNLSASELAAGLAARGHVVHYLASGMRHRPWPTSMIVRRPRAWRGVTCWDLINSATHSPAAVNFGNVSRELASPAQCERILAWLDRVKAQVVHVHSLEGQPLDLIAAIRRSGRPVVVTPHNYWFVCPQVDLLHEERRVCEDFSGGAKCETCMPRKPYWRVRAARTIGWMLEATVGQSLADGVRKMVYGGAVPRRRTKLGVSDLPIDPDVWRGREPPQNHDGRVFHAVAEDDDDVPPIEPGRSPWDMNERFLGATAHDAANAAGKSTTNSVHLKVVNDFGRRRLEGIAALNEADLVTPPSDFVRRVHITMGLDGSRTRVVRLGQPHFDQVHRRAKASPFYTASPWRANTADRPLAFGFFGTTRPNKGLEVLIRAIGLLERDVRQRCRFLIRASGWDWPFRKRVREFPEVQFAGGYDLIQLIAAGSEYDVGVVPHIWFENSPLVLLEHLHAGKMVICSRLGGPVEWVIEPGADGGGYNGLLFPGGDEESLSACITRLVRGDVDIPSPARVHDVTPNLQTYPGHVLEVESLYQELRERRG